VIPGLIISNGETVDIGRSTGGIEDTGVSGGILDWESLEFLIPRTFSRIFTSLTSALFGLSLRYRVLLQIRRNSRSASSRSLSAVLNFLENSWRSSTVLKSRFRNLHFIPCMYLLLSKRGWRGWAKTKRFQLLTSSVVTVIFRTMNGTSEFLPSSFSITTRWHLLLLFLQLQDVVTIWSPRLTTFHLAGLGCIDERD
jgi:hypothetical protein